MRIRSLFKYVFESNFWWPVLVVVFTLTVLIPTAMNVSFSGKATMPKITSTESSRAALSTPGSVTPHYTMSPKEWEEYQYRQSLERIDDRVAEQRMHNASLVAARQAVVECRGGTEWLALAVPGAQFVGTGVPCSLGVKP